MPEQLAAFKFSEIDLEILRLIHDYQYVTSDHVFALVNGNARHLADRLQQLFQRHYLERLLPPPAMRVAGEPPKGSEKFTYALAERGGLQVAEASGISLDELGWDGRRVGGAVHHIKHALMVATFRGSLELALRAPGAPELLSWQGEMDVRDAVHVLDGDGRTRKHFVAPDGYFQVREGGIERNFFLECDRATERDARILPKFQNYWLYTSPKSPFFRRYPNAQNRLILFVCTSEARLRAMRQTLVKADPEHRRGLAQFWFTLDSRFSLKNPQALLGPIWHQGPRTASDAQSGRPDLLRSLFDEKKNAL